MLIERINCWKDGMESEGLRVNMSKTKIMYSKIKTGQAENSGKWPCRVCRKGVGANSIACTVCKQWVHKRCSGLSGSLNNVSFERSICVGSEGREEEGEKDVQIDCDGKVECVGEFCYLGDLIGSGGGAEEASRARVRCAWSKFRELSPILTARGASLKVKGKLYRIYVQGVIMYGSETWAMKVEDMKRLERAENMMIRWMCGVTLKNVKASEELRQRLGIVSVADKVRQGRLRWFGHVERKDSDDRVSACRNLVVAGKKGRDRGRKTWKECVADDIRKLNLRKEDAQDRNIWRSDILGNRPIRASAETRTLRR